MSYEIEAEINVSPTIGDWTEYPSITIIRGHQGSGKSTIARKLAKHTTARKNIIVETDDFFTFGDEYIYDKDFGKDCFNMFLQRIDLVLRQSKFNVIVTGVLATELGLKPLFEVINSHNCNVLVVRATGEFQNVHDVPDHIVTKAKEVFLPFRIFKEIYLK